MNALNGFGKTALAISLAYDLCETGTPLDRELERRGRPELADDEDFLAAFTERVFFCDECETWHLTRDLAGATEVPRCADCEADLNSGQDYDDGRDYSGHYEP